MTKNVFLEEQEKNCRHSEKGGSEKENLGDRCWGGWVGRKEADVGRRCSLSVCAGERKRRREEVVFPLQQSVGSAFTVAEQSGRHSRPAGSTWHAISSAPGTLAAQPAQPKHTSIGDQNNAKQTHAEHTDNMWGVGVEGERQRHSSAAGVVCLLLVPRPVLPYSPTEVEEPLNYTAEDLLRFKVAYITIHTNCTNAVENFKLVS